MAILFNLVFFSSEFGRVNSEVLRYQKINLIPFRTIKNYISVRDYIDSTVVITNIFGNILAFMPFGFLLPIVLKARRKLLWFFVFSLILSGFIEFTQGFLGVGVVDIDDIILNVIGGCIGYIMFKVARHIILT